MKTFKTILISAAALSIAGSSFGVSSEAGTVASNILAIQPAARPAAMGGAFSAVGDDINSFYVNPAGLGFLRKSEGYASRFTGLGEIDANTVSVAIPLGDITSSNVRHLGVLAVGFNTLNYGKTDATDVTGAPIGQFNSKDNMLMIGWGKSIDNKLAFGSTAKLYQVEIGAQKNTGVNVDLGVVYKAVPNMVNLAVSGRNLGNSISYEGANANSPSAVVVGGALMPFATDRLVFTLDLDKPRDASSAVKTGVEWLPVNSLALRAGYDTSYDAGPGISIGAGIILLNLEVGFFPVDRLTLDYSFTPGTDLGYSHRIALSCRIGTQ